jgi:transposase
MLDFTMDGEVQKHRKQLVANAIADQTVSIAQYRDLARRYNRFLARYDDLKNQLQFYRGQCQDLECELRAIRPEVYQAYQKIDRQEKRLNKLEAENIALRKELAGIKEKLHQQPKVLPTFVKANVPKDKPRLRPGRKVGHAAALRPMPEKIDEYIDVPVPRDATGTACCPHCSVQLAEVEKHDRIVEDIIPAKVIARCYHTISGYCPGCRKRVESRAPEQPPAVDLPHGQIGINALTTAALLRVEYRLPYRLSTQLLADLPGLTVSPGAVTKQIRRMSQWLEGEYNRLQVFLRCAPAVHMDETSWRVNGINQWLWTLLDDQHTLFHVDKSRGQRVVQKLLGEVFGGVLVSDFYCGYSKLSARKQKCLVHLLRELKEASIKSPAFAKGSFCRRLKRLLKEMLLLKKNKPDMEVQEYQRRGKHMEGRLKELAQQRWDEPHADRLAARLGKHEKELTVFLWDDAVDGTNNAAERALRPAVVMRKITGGSRSERGARATAVLMSVLRTAHQQNRPLFETIKTLLMNAWAGKNPGLLTDILVDSS